MYGGNRVKEVSSIDSDDVGSGSDSTNDCASTGQERGPGV